MSTERSQATSTAPAPWSDCKVAFDVQDVKAAWSLKVGDLPAGWELVETDSSNTHAVAVFRVCDTPTATDGERALAALRKAGAL